MPARLTLYPPRRPAKRLVLEEGSEYAIGREPRADLSLDDDRVSRRHARLACDDGRWLLTDLASKNGSLVDGRIVGAEPREVTDGCWLSFGGVIGRFELLSPDACRAENEQERRRWQTSLDLQRGFDPSAGLEPLLQQVLESVLSLSGTERGFVLLARPDGELEVAATTGVGPDDLADRTFSGSVGAVEEALSEARPVVCCDALADERLGGRASVESGMIRAMVCLPLSAMDRTTGVLYADSCEPGTLFTELDVDILTAFASHASLVIAAARLREEVEGLAGAVPTQLDVTGIGRAPGGDLRELAEAWERTRGASSEPRAPEPMRPHLAGAASAGSPAGVLTWSDLLAAHAR